MGCPCMKCVTERRVDKHVETLKNVGIERDDVGVPTFDPSAIIKRYEAHIERYQWYINALKEFEKVAENRRIWLKWNGITESLVPINDHIWRRWVTKTAT